MITIVPRLITKCNVCKDLLWFGDTDVFPQTVVCPCGNTTLTEEGPIGDYVIPTAEEIASIT